MAGIIKVDRVQSDINLAFNIAGSNVAFMNATGLQMAGSNVSLAGNNVITNGRLVSSGLPASSVLQVVQSGLFSAVSTTSGSTQFSSTIPSITPSSSTSSILLLWSTSVQIDVDNDAHGSNNGSVRFDYQIGGTGGAWSNLGQFNVPGRGGNGAFTNAVFLLSPSTTSTVYFRLGVSKNEGARVIQINDAWGSNRLFMLEIAG